MKIDLTKLTLSLGAALMLSACSTLGGIGDAVGSINPFDKSDERAKEAQGDVAGETDRISILELNETLFDKLWSKDVGKGSARKGRVVAPPVVAGGRIFTMDGQNRVTAMDANTGDKIWDYKVALEERQKTRVGRTGIVERVRDPLSFLDGSGTDKESVGGGVAVADGKIFVTSGLGVVTALDAQSGEEIWTRLTRVPMHSAPHAFRANSRRWPRLCGL